MGVPPGRIDHIEIERFSPLGDTPILVLDARDDAAPYRSGFAPVIGLDREGQTPDIDPADFDCLLTTAPFAPRPWVSVPEMAFEDKAQSLEAAARATSHAAWVLRQALRLNEHRSVEDGLQIESLAYSTLLGGGEFRAWRAAELNTEAANLGTVDVAREDDHVTITLNQPDTHNAMTAAMRDALCNALAATLDDPSAPRVTLKAAGDCFSTGGDLGEFGSNKDLTQAHTIRSMRSVARLLNELGDRADVIFHGACIGSGLEAPAAAARRIALEGAFFQLPELKFGLIPGAGGTVTVTRAIGRHRAFTMMLGGARVSAATAQDWGLVHKVRPRP